MPLQLDLDLTLEFTGPTRSTSIAITTPDDPHPDLIALRYAEDALADGHSGPVDPLDLVPYPEVGDDWFDGF